MPALLSADEKKIALYHANNFLARFLGLFGRSARESAAIVIYPCSSIHTLFMKNMIDVVFLDRQKKVLRIHYSVKPYSLCSCAGSYYVVEAFSGSMKFNFCEGDSIEI